MKKNEERIKQIGQEIYRRAISRTPSIYNRQSWTGKVLEWAMKKEDFKVRLFRFIDVLPSLKSNSSVVKLVKEYFSEENLDLLGIFKVGVKDLPEKGFMAMAAARAIRGNIRLLSRQFIGGSDPEEAERAIRSLSDHGYAISAYILGEVVLSDREVEEYIKKNFHLLDTLARIFSEVSPGQRMSTYSHINMSIKLSSLYPWIDPMDRNGSIYHIRENIRPLLKRLREHHTPVIFDMEHYYYKTLLMDVFKHLIEEGELDESSMPGIALQSYLKESKKDLEDLLDWSRERKNPITVRLVKGAYLDYETVINMQRGWPVPVFTRKEETDLSFEELTYILMANRDIVYPAIATHNIRSIASAIAFSEIFNMGPEDFEFQMLYGMAEPIREALKDMGYRVRIYIPVGEPIPGMAYLVRRLLENTSSESFLKKSFVDKTPIEELMKPPGIHTSVKEISPEKGFKNEPLLDFSQDESRKRFFDALHNVRRDFNQKYPLIIGNTEVWTERGIISCNPASPGEIIGEVSTASIKEAEKVINEAQRTFKEWSMTGPEERATFLLKVADKMREERFALAALEVYEVGKNWKEADADVAEAIDYLIYYAREMQRLADKEPEKYPGEINEYIYIPKGVGVIISPWNFPLAIPTGMVAASIVTGNTAILKPSGNSPVIAWKLVDLFRSAGLPAGVLQFLAGSGKEIGEYLVGHTHIDFIAFTGSMDVGLRIVELAGKTHKDQRNIKRVIAEMGGKNAIIVDDTADLDEAVKGVLESAFGYQGQKCSACSRVIVLQDIYEEFCTRFRDAVESINIGHPWDPGNFMGPVIDKASLKKIREYITTGEREATPYLIRHVEEQEGYFIGPAIFRDVPPEARIAQEEIFGPVVSIMKASHMEKAIDMANSTPYALTGGIYSRSPVNIEKARRFFRVGNLYINRKITGALVGRQPFGGFGMSGIGSKAGGPDYLLQFMNPVCISENTLRKGFSASIYKWK